MRASPEIPLETLVLRGRLPPIGGDYDCGFIRGNCRGFTPAGAPEAGFEFARRRSKAMVAGFAAALRQQTRGTVLFEATQQAKRLTPLEAAQRASVGHKRRRRTELRSLLLAKHPHAIAVLLRVFLETSVDHYLTKVGIPLNVRTSGGQKDTQ